MKKSKIAFIATLTASTVGVINVLGAVIAYSLIVPDTLADTQTLIASNTGDVAVPVLPSPDQTVSTVPSTTQPTTALSSTGSQVVLRTGTQKLVPGKAPSPSSVATDSSGKQVFQWCSGANPSLPDEVCQAIVSIASNPVESNPHLGTKARQSLSLLPRDTSLTMDEESWEASGPSSGTMEVVADTSAYGTVRIKLFLEKQNNIWVLVDGQLA